MPNDTHDRPKSWRPRPGEIISGELIKYIKTTSTHGDAIIAVIKPETGDPTSVWLSTVLLRIFKKTRPKPGEAIAVKFVGMVQGKKHPYRDYRVALAREGDALDFSDDDTDDRVAEFDRSLQEPASPEADDAGDPF